MTWRQRFIAFSLGVGTLLIPACQALRNQCACCWPEEAPGEVADPQVSKSLATAGDQVNQSPTPAGSGVSAAPPRPDEPTPPRTLVIQQHPDREMKPPPKVELTSAPPQGPALNPDARPTTEPATEVKPTGTVTPEFPPKTAAPPATQYVLVRALYEFLDDRHEAAVQTLSVFEPNDQSLLLRLIPVIAQIEKARTLMPRISEDDRLTLVQVVRNWLAEAQDSAPLVVEKLVFCKEVLAFGKYQPVHSHQFRPGDRVMVYAELQNLCDRKAKGDDMFVTHLAATLEIRDASFQVVGKPILFRAESKSRSFRSDHFARMIFPIPADLAPGHYSLRVQITDLDSKRQTEKVLDFHLSTLASASAGR